MKATPCFVLLALGLAAQQPQSRAVERTLATHEQSLFFVIPPRDAMAGKSKKAGLVVVLPGGPGTKSFLPWVENGILGAAPDDCVGVMLTAVRWNAQQSAIWPVTAAEAKGMQYTTGDYVRAVVVAVEQDFDIDPARRVVLGWSSSGPAIYPLMAAKDAPFDRAYVAMAVWPKALEPRLKAVRQRRFLLDHSPADQRTTFRHARRAFAALDGAGAEVALVTYEGGHGWSDMPIPRIRDGLSWLLSSKPAPKAQWPPAPQASTRRKAIELLGNPGFEAGLGWWDQIDNSGRVTFTATTATKVGGAKALHVEKTGGAPLDLLRQEVALPAGRTLNVKLAVKTKDVQNARIKVWLYDDDDEAVHRASDVAVLSGTQDWHVVGQSWPTKGATYAVLQVLMVGGGEVWLDDASITVMK